MNCGAVHVAGSVDASGARAQELVDDDVALLVGIIPAVSKPRPSVAGVRPSANSTASAVIRCSLPAIRYATPALSVPSLTSVTVAPEIIVTPSSRNSPAAVSARSASSEANGRLPRSRTVTDEGATRCSVSDV